MSNYGVNIGKGNNYAGQTNIKNKTVIKKGRVIFSLTIMIAFVLVIAFMINKMITKDIAGSWVTEDGTVIEFLSDGTVHEDGYESLYADIYEIMDEGYLKWGKYDASWIEYRYTYWDIEINGNNMILTMRNNPDNTISLTRQ